MSASPVTTTVDITALVAMLRQIQCEPASFDTYSMASAAERAADAIERLQLSAIDDQEICRRGDEIILELDRKLAAAQSSATARDEQLAMANEALAACQAQAAGRIRELEGRLRAARFDDEIDDGDMDDEPESDYCECGALHSAGTEEMDSGRCAACGGLL